MMIYEFLLKDSLKNMKNNLNVIYLCEFKNEIIAFFALSTDAIKINEKILMTYKLG